MALKSKSEGWWVALRTMLYLGCIIGGLATAGVVGEMMKKSLSKNDDSCLLSTTMHEINVNNCQVDGTCTPSGGCEKRDGWSCSGGKCKPAQCLGPKGEEDTSPCKFAIIFGIVSGIFALFMFTILLYKTCKKTPAEFSHGFAEVMMGLLTGILTVCSLAMAAIVTQGYRRLCKSLEDYGRSCKETNKTVQESTLFPGFHDELELAAILGWVGTLCWLGLCVSSILRFRHHRLKAVARKTTKGGSGDMYSDEKPMVDEDEPSSVI